LLLNAPPLTTDVRIGDGRVVLVFEYDGTNFHGWQFQKSGVRSVAGELAAAVAKVADHPVELVCAGRTDAGVHASYQVAHFETTAIRSLRAWVMGINTALPDDIAVHWAGQAKGDFHARFSAFYRRYRYIIHNHPVRPGLLKNSVTWHYRELNAEAMNRAAQALVGEHDFSSFRAAGCQSNSPNRNVETVSVQRFGDYVILDIRANAFLHHMVRNITGALLKVGTGEQPEQWIADVLAIKDRRLAGITAPPSGLYLVDVGYPASFDVPNAAVGPTLLRPWLLSHTSFAECGEN